MKPDVPFQLKVQLNEWHAFIVVDPFLFLILDQSILFVFAVLLTSLKNTIPMTIQKTIELIKQSVQFIIFPPDSPMFILCGSISISS